MEMRRNGMSMWENNGNGNKYLAGVGMGMELKLMGMERNAKVERHSRTSLVLGRCELHSRIHKCNLANFQIEKCVCWLSHK